MTITEEKSQPHAATIVEGPARPARSPRRHSWRKVATWAVACGAVVLAAGAYLADDESSEPAAARARSADSARLQAQGDAYAARQAVTVRARSADSARLQAQGDAYAAREAVTVRARSADSARLQAQGDAYAAREAVTVRARSADSARLQAQADAYAGELRGGGS